MDPNHPAMIASRNSWSAVQRKAKDEWLALFADDAVIEDPIGRSPLDPDGKGKRGRAAIEEFWDSNIGPNTIEVGLGHSRTAGMEAAHQGILTTTFPDGRKMVVEDIFTYRVNDAGQLVSMRGFWDMSDLRAG